MRPVVRCLFEKGVSKVLATHMDVRCLSKRSPCQILELPPGMAEWFLKLLQKLPSHKQAPGTCLISLEGD